MSSFQTPLILQFLDRQHSNHRFKVVEEFKYLVGKKYNPETKTLEEDIITVKPETSTDFASIPWFLWSILPPTGRYGKAAVIHDYLYEYRLRPRKEADKIFLNAMKELGVPGWKRNIMYCAVRCFGPRYTVAKEKENPLLLEFIYDPETNHHFRLTQPFKYNIGTETHPREITVPSDFTTDFATIDQFFWSILPPIGLHGKAAVIHDYLYSQEAIASGISHSKKEADAIFKQAMKKLGVTKWKRVVLFLHASWCRRYPKNSVIKSTAPTAS